MFDWFGIIRLPLEPAGRGCSFPHESRLADGWRGRKPAVQCRARCHKKRVNKCVQNLRSLLLLPSALPPLSLHQQIINNAAAYHQSPPRSKRKAGHSYVHTQYHRTRPNLHSTTKQLMLYTYSLCLRMLPSLAFVRRSQSPSFGVSSQFTTMTKVLSSRTTIKLCVCVVVVKGFELRLPGVGSLLLRVFTCGRDSELLPSIICCCDRESVSTNPCPCSFDRCCLLVSPNDAPNANRGYRSHTEVSVAPRRVTPLLWLLIARAIARKPSRRKISR